MALATSLPSDGLRRKLPDYVSAGCVRYAAGQREHLRLVLQSPERCGEDEAVVIPLKFRTVLVTLFMKLFQAESFGGYEGIPVHHVLTFLLFNCKCMTICFKIRNFAR